MVRARPGPHRPSRPPPRVDKLTHQRGIDVNGSKAASDRARELGLEDLRTYCWHCPIMGKHRKQFLWEHHKPVADMRNEIYSMGPKVRLEEVAAILGKTRIAWVLQSEGKKLGNKSRPNPAATYRDAGVVLLYPWDKCRPIDRKRHRAP